MKRERERERERGGGGEGGGVKRLGPLCLANSSYITRWQVSEWFSDLGESWKNSLWAWRERWNPREAILGGGKIQQDRFTRSIWQKQRRCQGQALTSGACLFHTVLRSVARLSMSAVLPRDVEAVLCKLYSHYTYAAVHTKISTNTRTKVIKGTGMIITAGTHPLMRAQLKRVQSTKGQGPVYVLKNTCTYQVTSQQIKKSNMAATAAYRA